MGDCHTGKAGVAAKNTKILAMALLVFGLLGCLISFGQAADEAQVE